VGYIVAYIETRGFVFAFRGKRLHCTRIYEWVLESLLRYFELLLSYIENTEVKLDI
jgi:hypothetical protein